MELRGGGARGCHMPFPRAEPPQKRPCIHRCGPVADEEAVPPVAPGRLRKAESGPGWRELFLSERCDAGATPSAAAAVAAGHSLLQFDVLASASECGALLSEAAALAAAVRAEHFGEDRPSSGKLP